MKEVKILRVEKKGKKYQVYTDYDDEPIKLTEDSIVNNRIFKGSILEEDIWKKIKSGNDAANLFDKALSYIDFKPRTEKEIKQYLIKKEADDKAIEEIIKRLKDIRYLDDDKYANAYIDECIRNKKGPSMITYQLEELGIEKSIINKYLSKYTYDIQYDNALEVAKKYQKLQLKYPAKKQRELIYQKLIRSGYYMDTINRVLSNLTFQEDSIDNLLVEYEKLLKKTSDKNKIITSLMGKGYRYEDIKKVIN